MPDLKTWRKEFVNIVPDSSSRSTETESLGEDAKNAVPPSNKRSKLCRCKVSVSAMKPLTAFSEKHASMIINLR
jgi:hypothetical protein